jgi:hypothetical protein
MTRLKGFPRHRLIEDPLCRVRTSELSLYQSLGEPTSTTDPIDMDPRLYWDLEWSCGLLTSMQFHQLSELLEISLDEPDVAHALRHIRVEAYDMHLLRIDDPARFMAICAPPDLTWELWRVNPDGREQQRRHGLTRRDAECWAREAEAHTGNRYWARQAGQAGQAGQANPPV